MASVFPSARTAFRVGRHCLQPRAGLPSLVFAQQMGRRYKSGGAPRSQDPRSMMYEMRKEMTNMMKEQQESRLVTPTGGKAVNPYLPPVKYAWPVTRKGFRNLRDKFGTWLMTLYARMQLNQELKRRGVKPPFEVKAFLEHAKTLFLSVNQKIATNTIASSPDLVVETHMTELVKIAKTAHSPNVAVEFTASGLRAKLVSLAFAKMETGAVDNTFAQAVVEFSADSLTKTAKSFDGKPLKSIVAPNVTEFWVFEWMLASKNRWRVLSKLKRSEAEL